MSQSIEVRWALVRSSPFYRPRIILSHGRWTTHTPVPDTSKLSDLATRHVRARWHKAAQYCANRNAVEGREC